ncbi:hypothetical protein BT69DRAFT_1283506 [Atractiella rhizophila]|nr:hypothetical protein BT69DRAFT_1283506 [Atractiella rhizophila]
MLPSEYPRTISNLQKIADEILPGIKFSAESAPALRVVFDETTHLETAKAAISRQATLNKPVIFCDLGRENKDQKFTIMMIDPDLFMKNDPISGQVRHWLQGGLTYTSYSDPLITISPPVTAYMPCAPAPGTGTNWVGTHRYVFILAKEDPAHPPSREDFEAADRKDGEEDLKDRMRFNAEEYIKKKQMKVVALNVMEVTANAASTAENLKLGAEAVVNKVMGK